MKKIKIMAAVLSGLLGLFRVADAAALANSKDTLSKIHSINLFEIQMGTLAWMHSPSLRVRRYGVLLIRDHRFADKMTIALAKKEHLPIASIELDSADKLAIQKLNKADRKTFDRDFLQAMQDGHEKAMTMLTSAKDTAGSPQVSRFVEKLLPIFDQHGDLAKHLQAK